MNVTIDAMKGSTTSRLLWWITLASVIVIGLALRLLSIDRGTPAIGAVVYALLLAVMVAVIALPASAIFALAWHYTAKISKVRFSRAIVRRIGTRERARCLTTIVVALATFIAMSATGRIPKWHVWMSVAAVNALVAWRLFGVFTHALRALANEPRIESRPAHDLRTSTFARKSIVRSATANYASDDRRARDYWRERRQQTRLQH
jgi:hypothetical protein